MYKVQEATKKGYVLADIGDSINIAYSKNMTKRGRVGKQKVNTITTGCNHAVVTNELRIRKLTPKECWRLMGFLDEEYDLAAELCSNTQLYKQAGNSIVVDVLEKILENLFEDELKDIEENERS